MLSQTSINSVYSLAAIVSRKGKVLGVKDGTPLADLLAVCDPLDAGFEGVEVSSLAPADIVAEQSDTADHSEQAVNLVELASRAVAFTMDVARNHVTPMVKLVVECTEAYIDTNRSKRLEPLLIHPQFIAPIYEATELHDLLAKHAQAPDRDVPPVQLTATYGDSTDVGPLMSGIPSFDGEVVRHFEGREAEVASLWQRYFAAVPGNYRAADWREDLTTPDQALIVFLGAHALLESNDVPEGMTLSLPAYRAYLAGLEEQAGSHLAFLLNKIKTAVGAKQLVVSAPKQSRPGDPLKGVIAVNGPVYNQWLAEGGSPEALCGAVMQGASTDYGSCLMNAESHSAAWQRALNVLHAQVAFELRTSTIQGLKEGLLKASGTIPPEERLVDGDSLMAAVEAHLVRLADSGLENLYAIATDEVCDLFYPHTDAKAFLKAMNREADAHPGMDIREVALGVAIDYVTGWVSDAITVADASAVAVVGEG